MLMALNLRVHVAFTSNIHLVAASESLNVAVEARRFSYLTRPTIGPVLSPDFKASEGPIFRSATTDTSNCKPLDTDPLRRWNMWRCKAYLYKSGLSATGIYKQYRYRIVHVLPKLAARVETIRGTIVCSTLGHNIDRVSIQSS
jgi:hypothetical protein